METHARLGDPRKRRPTLASAQVLERFKRGDTPTLQVDWPLPEQVALPEPRPLPDECPDAGVTQHAGGQCPSVGPSGSRAAARAASNNHFDDPDMSPISDSEY